MAPAPSPIEWQEPTPQQREQMLVEQRESARKQTITTVAMHIIMVQKITSDSIDPPRAIARKAFDLAMAFWDELEARGLQQV